jgi:hypothetical protein
MEVPALVSHDMYHIKRTRELPKQGSRHCEPTGRANARPMTGFRKATTASEKIDGFVALLLANDESSL